MTKNERRKYRSEEKVKILSRHLLGKELVSDICDELSLSPNQFYRWQKEFFENGSAAFERRSREASQKKSKLEEKVEHLETKLKNKDEVIAEITEEYVKLKKNFGEI